MSLPLGRFNASIERISASSPLATPMQCLAPMKLVNSVSKLLTSWPRMYQPERITRVAAASMSSMNAALDKPRFSYSIICISFIRRIDIFTAVVGVGRHDQQHRARAKSHRVPIFWFHQEALSGRVQLDGIGSDAVVQEYPRCGSDSHPSLSSICIALATAVAPAPPMKV